MEKIISIVTPTYNYGHFIEETIDSVLNQEGEFYLDYIVVDGGSKDNTVEILKKYENQIKNIPQKISIEGLDFYTDQTKFKNLGISFRWISEKDKGHFDALNKGFKKSVGNVLAWINSDDKYHPEAFKTVLEVFDDFPSIEWITGKNSWWNKEGDLSYSASYYNNVYNFLLNNYIFIQQESTFWRRSLWEKAGGKINENYKLMVDGELWCRYFKFTELYHVDKMLGGYRTHDTNRAKTQYQEVLNEMSTAIEQLKKDLPANIVSRSNKLNIIKKFYNRAPRFLRKVIVFINSILFSSTRYKVVVKINNEWNIIHKPFRLENVTR